MIHEQGGSFDARWHFSFDRYRDPEQMGVGALRVGNDDRIIAGAEWPLRFTGNPVCGTTPPQHVVLVLPR